MYQCTVLIDRLRINALIGILPEEQGVPQPIEVSVKAVLKKQPTCLAESLNYADVVSYIENRVQQQTQLVEELAKDIADYCCQSMVKSVSVKVMKVGILLQTAGVGCCVVYN